MICHAWQFAVIYQLRKRMAFLSACQRRHMKNRKRKAFFQACRMIRKTSHRRQVFFLVFQKNHRKQLPCN